MQGPESKNMGTIGDALSWGCQLRPWFVNGMWRTEPEFPPRGPGLFPVPVGVPCVLGGRLPGQGVPGLGDGLGEIRVGACTQRGDDGLGLGKGGVGGCGVTSRER